MNEERFFELVTNYLANEISDEEKNELSTLLQDVNNKKNFDSIVAKWKAESRGDVKFDTDVGIMNLTKKLKECDSSFEWEKETVTKKSIFFRPALLKIAASILILIASSLVLYFSIFQTGEPAELIWNEKITALGKKSIIRYTDGTKITLNAGSKLKYPQKFDRDSREVFLDGEAFFEVAHNSQKPFIVYSDGIKTTVLGTKFNVYAYPDENKVSVALVEGKVRVEPKNNSDSKNVRLLKPKQELIYDRKTKMSKILRFDLNEKIGWKDNILKFKDEPLINVFKKLEREYGVEFELADTSYTSRKFTANFKNEKFWTVVTVIQKLTKLNYRNEAENKQLTKIIFYKKPPIKKTKKE